MQWTVRRAISCNTQDSLTEMKASPSLPIIPLMVLELSILVLSFNLKELKPRPFENTLKNIMCMGPAITQSIRYSWLCSHSCLSRCDCCTFSPILALHLLTIGQTLLHYTSKPNLLQSKAEMDLHCTKPGRIFLKNPKLDTIHMRHRRR